MVMADGVEIPASVILRDEDLDLAYIAPSAPFERSFTHVGRGGELFAVYSLCDRVSFVRTVFLSVS